MDSKQDLHARVENDLTLHPVTEGVGGLMDELRGKAKELAHLVVEHVPAGRECSTALTKIEEGLFHAVAGLARHQPTVVSAPTATADAGAPPPS